MVKSSACELLEQALELPRRERAALAHRPLRSLEASQAPDAATGVREAWCEERERRARDLDGGQVALVPGEEVEAEVRAILAKKRGRRVASSPTPRSETESPPAPPAAPPATGGTPAR